MLFGFLTALFCSLIFFSYGNPYLSLVYFLLMLFSHQQSMVFYNSLLLNFEEKGITSGLGVAFGYLGSAFALTLLVNFLKEPSVYLYTAFLFFLFFLPSAFFLENPRERGFIKFSELLRDKRFLVFLLSYFSLSEVANTLIAMMSVYLKAVYGLENMEIYRIIGFSALGGVLGGLFWGFMTDKFGVNRIFPLGFLNWILFLFLLYFVNRDFLLFVGVWGGLSLSHLWTTGRVFLIENFPRENVSLRLSFLSLSERVASSTGVWLWSFFLFLTEDYRLSSLLMVFLPIIGGTLFLLLKKEYSYHQE
ncbi:MFS transporter [Aquifex pyrophilus]